MKQNAQSLKIWVQNHNSSIMQISLATVFAYIYTVHQRTLAIPITAVIIVIFMKVVNYNQLRQVAAFLGDMLVCISIHSIIKGGWRNPKL